METIVKKSKRFSILILFLIGCSSNNEPEIELDPYSMQVQCFYKEGRMEIFEDAELLKYKKNGLFDSLVSEEFVKIDHMHYNKVQNHSRFFINEVDYHFDFILRLMGKDTVEKHKFSDIKIEKFNYGGYKVFQISKFNYNDSLYQMPGMIMLTGTANQEVPN